MLPYNGGRAEAVVLQGSIQPDSGMLLLLMSGSTLQPGSSPEGGGGSLAIKEKSQLLPSKGEVVVALGLHGSVQPDRGMMLLMSGFTLQPGNRLRVDLRNKKKMPVASLY